MEQQPFIKEGYEIIDLPKKDLTLHQEEVKRDLPKYWDKEYINTKIRDIQNHKHKMLITFLWYTGVRISEALQLKKQDIDFINYTINIRWQKNRKFNQRNIALHPRLKDILEVFCATMNQADLLFPMSRQRAFQLTKKYLGGNPHKIRHSFAVNWLRGGGDIFILSKMLGHADIRQTQIYLQIVPMDQGKELIKISFD